MAPQRVPHDKLITKELPKTPLPPTPPTPEAPKPEVPLFDADEVLHGDLTGLELLERWNNALSLFASNSIIACFEEFREIFRQLEYEISPITQLEQRRPEFQRDSYIIPASTDKSREAFLKRLNLKCAARLRFNAGMLKAVLGEYFLAKTWFEEAIKADREMAIAWYASGIANAELGEWRSAASSFDHVMKRAGRRMKALREPDRTLPREIKAFDRENNGRRGTRQTQGPRLKADYDKEWAYWDVEVVRWEDRRLDDPYRQFGRKLIRLKQISVEWNLITARHHCAKRLRETKLKNLTSAAKRRSEVKKEIRQHTIAGKVATTIASFKRGNSQKKGETSGKGKSAENSPAKQIEAVKPMKSKEELECEKAELKVEIKKAAETVASDPMYRRDEDRAFLGIRYPFEETGVLNGLPVGILLPPPEELLRIYVEHIPVPGRNSKRQPRQSIALPRSSKFYEDFNPEPELGFKRPLTPDSLADSTDFDDFENPLHSPITPVSPSKEPLLPIPESPEVEDDDSSLSSKKARLHRSFIATRTLEREARRLLSPTLPAISPELEHGENALSTEPSPVSLPSPLDPSFLRKQRLTMTHARHRSLLGDSTILTAEAYRDPTIRPGTRTHMRAQSSPIIPTHRKPEMLQKNSTNFVTIPNYESPHSLASSPRLQTAPLPSLPSHLVRIAKLRRRAETAATQFPYARKGEWTKRQRAGLPERDDAYDHFIYADVREIYEYYFTVDINEIEGNGEVSTESESEGGSGSVLGGERAGAVGDELEGMFDEVMRFYDGQGVEEELEGIEERVGTPTPRARKFARDVRFHHPVTEDEVERGGLDTEGMVRGKAPRDALRKETVDVESVHLGMGEIRFALEMPSSAGTVEDDE